MSFKDYMHMEQFPTPLQQLDNLSLELELVVDLLEERLRLLLEAELVDED